jgi:PTS system mannose-specific IIA component
MIIKMISLLVVTHGNLGKELINSAELIAGKQDDVVSLGLFLEDGIDNFKERVHEKILSTDQGEGVLVFVDLYGGSPCNVTAMSMRSQKDLEQSKVECITGVNLPMILEAMTMRKSMSLRELKNHCMQIGCSGIKDIYQEMHS